MAVINSGTGQAQQVYYDANSGRYYTQAAPGTNPFANTAFATYRAQQANTPRDYITGPFGAGSSQAAQPAAPIAPRSYVPAGLQVYGGDTQATPYQRPTMPTAPTGTGYRPQFDMSFIQQMLAQRMGGQAPRPPAAPTLTPGAVQNYGAPQGLGGLAALRGISAGNVNPTGGTPNAGV